MIPHYNPRKYANKQWTNCTKMNFYSVVGFQPQVFLFFWLRYLKYVLKSTGQAMRLRRELCIHSTFLIDCVTVNVESCLLMLHHAWTCYNNLNGWSIGENMTQPSVWIPRQGDHRWSGGKKEPIETNSLRCFSPGLAILWFLYSSRSEVNKVVNFQSCSALFKETAVAVKTLVKQHRRQKRNKVHSAVAGCRKLHLARQIIPMRAWDRHQ